jgi:biopolymer transport protein ExbB/TolQ
MDTSGLAHDIEQTIFTIAKLLLYPVLVAAIACLIWVLIELGYFLYEVYLRVRYRDLDALEIRTLRAREAFNNGQPRKAYRYLQENNYSMVVVRFLFDLIRNYQGQRLAEKPLKLLQEYEFYTIKRLEKTRILVRVGPMLGLMGTLIPLAPALEALANNDTATLANQLEIAFSVTVIGLLIGGLAFTISILRDRFYSQDISDLEYLLELLEGSGGRLRAGGGIRAGKAKPAEEAEEEEEPEAAIAAEGIAAEEAILVSDDGGMLPEAAAVAERRLVHIDEGDVIGGRDFEPVVEAPEAAAGEVARAEGPAPADEGSGPDKGSPADDETAALDSVHSEERVGARESGPAQGDDRA